MCRQHGESPISASALPEHAAASLWDRLPAPALDCRSGRRTAPRRDAGSGPRYSRFSGCFGRRPYTRRRRNRPASGRGGTTGVHGARSSNERQAPSSSVAPLRESGARARVRCGGVYPPLVSERGRRERPGRDRLSGAGSDSGPAEAGSLRMPPVGRGAERLRPDAATGSPAAGSAAAASHHQPAARCRARRRDRRRGRRHRRECGKGRCDRCRYRGIDRRHPPQRSDTSAAGLPAAIRRAERHEHGAAEHL